MKQGAGVRDGAGVREGARRTRTSTHVGRGRWTPGRAAILLVGLIAAACTGDAGPDEEAALPPEIQGIRGMAPEATGGVRSVVMLDPVGAPEAAPVEVTTTGEEPVTIDQFGLAFSPTTAVVPVGEVLRFTNLEASLVHNVEIRSIDQDSTVFYGDAASGEVIDVPLLEVGGYDVLCDYHPGMTAFAFATDATYTVIAELDGSFELLAPPGEYTLRVWSADPGRRSEHDIVLGAGTTAFVVTGAP